MAIERINTSLPEVIHNKSVVELMNLIDSVKAEHKEVTWLSDGGSVIAGWTFAEYLISSPSKIDANVSGWALSMGGLMLPFFNYTRGAKQSWVMVHAPVGGTSKMIKKVVQDVIEAFIAKVDSDEFKKITGVSIEDALSQSGEDRVDYWLTGQQAYDIGLYDELFDITPVQEAQNRSKMASVAASASDDYGFTIPDKVYKTPSNEGSSLGNQNQNVKKMDINKLKAEYPDLIKQVEASAYDAGKVDGVKAESDRVGSFMVYNDIDAVTVKAGIEGGEAMSATQAAEFNRKAVVAAVNKGVEDEAPENTPTPNASADDVDEVTAKANAALAEMGITETKA